MRWLVGAWLVVLCVTSVPAAPESASGKPVLVALDFRSTYDDGKMGAKVAEVITGHARRSGKFQTYDFLSRDEILGALGFEAGPETSAEEVAKVGREGFGAKYVFWGEVRPARSGCYIHFKIVDCTTEPPRLVIDEERAADDVHKIPLIVDEVLRELTSTTAPVEAPDPAAERAWKVNRNLLPNGSFEKGSDHPEGWEELPDYARWVANPDGPGRCIKFDLDRERARSYGGLYYSDYVTLRPGATYRFQVRIKSLRPTPMVFLKGYDELPAKFGFPAERREVYRRPIHAEATGAWETYTTDFTPRSPTYTPRWLRAQLYAYGAEAGVIYFDDCILKEIKPPSTGGQKQGGDVRRESKANH